MCSAFLIFFNHDKGSDENFIHIILFDFLYAGKENIFKPINENNS